MAQEQRPFEQMEEFELLELLYCLNFPNGTLVADKRDKFIGLILREQYLKQIQNQKRIQNEN